MLVPEEVGCYGNAGRCLKFEIHFLERAALWRQFASAKWVDHMQESSELLFRCLHI